MEHLHIDPLVLVKHWTNTWTIGVCGICKAMIEESTQLSDRIMLVHVLDSHPLEVGDYPPLETLRQKSIAMTPFNHNLSIPNSPIMMENPVSNPTTLFNYKINKVVVNPVPRERLSEILGEEKLHSFPTNFCFFTDHMFTSRLDYGSCLLSEWIFSQESIITIHGQLTNQSPQQKRKLRNSVLAQYLYYSCKTCEPSLENASLRLCSLCKKIIPNNRADQMLHFSSYIHFDSYNATPQSQYAPMWIKKWLKESIVIVP